jgi:hypothetical protein
MIRMIDLFSGIGGFRLAAEWVWPGEVDCVGHSEIEPYPCKVYHRHFPESECLGDITKIDWEAILDITANDCYIKLSQEQLAELDMAGKQKNYQEAVRLYETGLSIQNIADFFGVTRQAMWYVLKRRGVAFRDNKRFGQENHFHRGGVRASDRAQNLLEEAVERKIVERKTHCEKCGDTGAFKDGRTAIQAHHSDYNKPLEVMWLCQKCHHEWHKTNKAIPRKEGMPVEAAKSAEIDLLTGGVP